MNKVLTLETNKYAIRLDNFEGPLDLLCHLIDKNKMEISEVNISMIADQYIEYIKKMEELNLDIASEFVLMASTLLYIKSRSLLPNAWEDEGELTEEELINRIIEYKKYKEISKTFRELYDIYSKRVYKLPEKIEMPGRRVEESYVTQTLYDTYKELLRINKEKMNENIDDIKKISIMETITVRSKVKDIFKQLMKTPKFIFNKLCVANKYTKIEVVTAFTGLLELLRKNKVRATQKEVFGDISVERVERTSKLVTKGKASRSSRNSSRKSKNIS